jgi:vacuolar-type H+-ATPase subunit E/Vma4
MKGKAEKIRKEMKGKAEKIRKEMKGKAENKKGCERES